ncbi:MAG: glycosyltransferase [Nocardioidaceae bacterium]|nr:glycosyltransferase [Nocardioidaceae bacterium]MCL2614164.1 glycosyltransferase [Nocardioidaceae bacterium]
MKILIDAMAAEFGGIRTLIDAVLAQWLDVFPDDELHVAVPATSTIGEGTPHRLHRLPVAKPYVVGRPWAQTTRMRSLSKRLRPDAVLATAPTTSVLPFGDARVATIILDLRHELRPEQFSRGRRFIRDISYGRTYQLADAFIAISQRSLDDLHELHPRTRSKDSVVAHLGADHVHDWPAPDRTGPAISFAHHTNKNPDLLLDAWADLAARGGTVPELLVLGVGGARRPALQEAIDARGIGDRVRLAPFLPDAEFQQVLASADMVVFPTDFEGFGLPTVEGMVLGKPVVIGPEKACLEVAGGHAVVMDGWTPQALADAVLRATEVDDAALDAARQWADTFTWERTIRRIRSVLAP